MPYRQQLQGCVLPALPYYVAVGLQLLEPNIPKGALPSGTPGTPPSWVSCICMQT
jgi:hypothetical protein